MMLVASKALILLRYYIQSSLRLEKKKGSIINVGADKNHLNIYYRTNKIKVLKRVTYGMKKFVDFKARILLACS